MAPREFLSAEFFLEGILTPILGIFGFFGNVLSIKVLSSRDLDMMPSIKHLLKMLAAFDAVFLVFTLTLFCISAWSEHYNDFIRPWLTPYMLPVIQISLTGSVYATVAVSVERFLTVCCSYRHAVASVAPDGTASRIFHLSYTLPILLFSFSFNITRFFELKTEKIYKNVTETILINSNTNSGEENIEMNTNATMTILENSTGTYVNMTKVVYAYPEVQPTELRQDVDYSFYFVLMANSLGLVFIPILVLIGLNTRIFWTINLATQRHNAISTNQRRDHSVAMMLILIVVVFIICHSIRSVVNAFEFLQFYKYGEIKEWPDWVDALVHVNHFALVVNSSINILIYSCKDDKFLAVMLKTMGLKSRIPMRLRQAGQRNGRTSTMPRPSVTNASVLIADNGVSSTQYIPGKLLAPPQSSPLPHMQRVRSFDFGHRTNLLGTNSISSTMITHVGSATEVFSSSANLNSNHELSVSSNGKSWNKNIVSHPLDDLSHQHNNSLSNKDLEETEDKKSNSNSTPSYEAENIEEGVQLLNTNKHTCHESDDLHSISKRSLTCPLIQIPNTDTGSNTDSASKQHDNLSQNADPSFTNLYQETSLCDRDCSDSRRSSFEICYCNGSNTSNACSCEMARCEGECDASPIGSTMAETANGYLSMTDKLKEESENDVKNTRSENSLKTHVTNIAGDLISLESPKHTCLDNKLNSTESIPNSHQKKTTISTQTPSSSNQT